MSEREVPRSALEIRAEIQCSPVPIWRRILIPSHLPLERVSSVLATLFEQEGTIERYEFRKGRALWAWPEGHLHTDALDGRRVLLGEVLTRVGECLAFSGGWNGDWQLELTLEGICTGPGVEPGRVLLLDGEGAAPPRAVFGPEDYDERLAVLADPAHPEHRVTSDQLGWGFDPTRFARARLQVVLDRLRLPACAPHFPIDDAVASIDALGERALLSGGLMDDATCLLFEYDEVFPEHVARAERPEILAAAALHATALMDGVASTDAVAEDELARIACVSVSELIEHAERIREAMRIRQEEWGENPPGVWPPYGPQYPSEPLN